MHTRGGGGSEGSCVDRDEEAEEEEEEEEIRRERERERERETVCVCVYIYIYVYICSGALGTAHSPWVATGQTGSQVVPFSFSPLPLLRAAAKFVARKPETRCRRAACEFEFD